MALEVRCPHCTRLHPWDSANRWRPFCCERCRMIDLGAWLDERHVIPGDDTVGPEDPDAPRH